MITYVDLPTRQDNEIGSNYEASKQRWYAKLPLMKTLKHMLLGEVGCTRQYINLLLINKLRREIRYLNCNIMFAMIHI